jgi:hypothetical protein
MVHDKAEIHVVQDTRPKPFEFMRLWETVERYAQ